jgi:hypothetical protein
LCDECRKLYKDARGTLHGVGEFEVFVYFHHRTEKQILPLIMCDNFSCQLSDSRLDETFWNNNTINQVLSHGSTLEFDSQYFVFCWDDEWVSWVGCTNNKCWRGFHQRFTD